MGNDGEQQSLKAQKWFDNIDKVPKITFCSTSPQKTNKQKTPLFHSAATQYGLCIIHRTCYSVIIRSMSWQSLN